jgi:hypothetical protein
LKAWLDGKRPVSVPDALVGRRTVRYTSFTSELTTPRLMPAAVFERAAAAADEAAHAALETLLARNEAQRLA